MSDVPIAEPRPSGWVAVRCVFRSEVEGTQLYEERITLWLAASTDEAFRRAEAEAEEYAELLSSPGSPTEYLGLAQAYQLDDTPGEGAEVFSMMRTSDLAAQDYLDSFFSTGVERQTSTGDGDDR